LALGSSRRFTRRRPRCASNSALIIQWSIITSGFALAFAAGLGALGQGRAVGSAVEAIARNPSATNDIRGSLLLGLVLIESLVIYVLLVVADPAVPQAVQRVVARAGAAWGQTLLRRHCLGSDAVKASKNA
jgi:F0F1-type ATP synthase membrane subunit c/vacuolar-type H+-ATPase subunit K